MLRCIKHILLLFILMPITSHAAYEITGKLNMKGEWQHQIYLATIDRLDDYYDANADYIINVASISDNGEFSISGDNLPEESQFYRLYLVKEEHSEFNACLYVGGEEHNFIHLILNNESQINISADTHTYAPFGDYTIEGDYDNSLMKSLGLLVYPSYVFYEIKFPSELRFSQDKLNRDLLLFADTCGSTLVSLAAINNTDYTNYYESNKMTYLQVGSRLKEEWPDHQYTLDYNRKMRYYDYDDSNTSSIYQYIAGGLGVLLFLSQIYIYILKRRFYNDDAPDQKEILIEQLTTQEIKILQLISGGHSNKEIASQLYIEVSTVKSHINKLYAKLHVKNRQEAIKSAQKHQLSGV